MNPRITVYNTASNIRTHSKGGSFVGIGIKLTLIKERQSAYYGIKTLINNLKDILNKVLNVLNSLEITNGYHGPQFCPIFQQTIQDGIQFVNPS